jgi:hypothetical protein
MNSRAIEDLWIEPENAEKSMTKAERNQRLCDKSTSNSSCDIESHRLSKCWWDELSDSSLYELKKVALSVLKKWHCRSVVFSSCTQYIHWSRTTKNWVKETDIVSCQLQDFHCLLFHGDCWWLYLSIFSCLNCLMLTFQCPVLDIVSLLCASAVSFVCRPLSVSADCFVSPVILVIVDHLFRSLLLFVDGRRLLGISCWLSMSVVAKVLDCQCPSLRKERLAYNTFIYKEENCKYDYPSMTSLCSSRISFLNAAKTCW